MAQLGGSRPRTDLIERVEEALYRRRKPPPGIGDRVEFGDEANRTRLSRKRRRGERNVVRGAVNRGGYAETVCERETQTDWMPEPWFDRHKCASRTQHVCGLLDARSQRALKRDVVQDQAVEHYVDRSGRETQSSGMTNECLIGLAGRTNRLDTIGIRINRDQPIVRSWEEMPARMPPAANREHHALPQSEATTYQPALALEYILVVGLEGRLLAEGIEQVVCSVGGTHLPMSGTGGAHTLTGYERRL